MAGVLGCFAFGVGSTDMANAWYTKDIRIRVPETVRYVLKGKKRPDVAAKDVMLSILLDYAKPQMTLDRIIEFTGPGLRSLSMDERATLANMATECSARTAIVEADERTFEWIAMMRPGVDIDRLRARAVAHQQLPIQPKARNPVTHTFLGPWSGRLDLLSQSCERSLLVGA